MTQSITTEISDVSGENVELTYLVSASGIGGINILSFATPEDVTHALKILRELDFDYVAYCARHRIDKDKLFITINKRKEGELFDFLAANDIDFLREYFRRLVGGRGIIFHIMGPKALEGRIEGGSIWLV